MAEIKVKNVYLFNIYDMISDIGLIGRESRHRTKVVKQIVELHKEYVEDRDKLAKEAAQRDENGEVVYADEERSRIQLEPSKQVYYTEEIVALENEEVPLEILDLTIVYNIFDNLQKELSGLDAEVYAYIMDKIEEEMQLQGIDVEAQEVNR